MFTAHRTGNIIARKKSKNMGGEMSNNIACIIAAVKGVIHGLLFVYFLNEKKWLGLSAVMALIVLEVVR